jgi:hypothetical protein
MVFRPTIWFVNAIQSCSALPMVCEQAQRAGQAIHVLYHARDRDTILQSASTGHELIRLIELADGAADLSRIDFDKDAEIIFLPCVDSIDWTGFRQHSPLGHPHTIQPLVAATPSVNPLHYTISTVDWLGWRTSGALAPRILREPSAWLTNGVELVEAIQRWPDPPRWRSIPLALPAGKRSPACSSPRLTMSSSVLVVISFYGCEEWLHACLTSISQQSRSPENIVVIDDSSPALPVKFLEPFPNVTLLSTTRNVGPEKILNNIIKATDYDAYMIQDADDWSSHDRLELSLRALEQSGADIAGTQEIRLDLPRNAIRLYAYPEDVNFAMSRMIGHHLLHGSTLISRSLATKIGGFDEQLKVCADADFSSRAWHAGRIVNIPSFCLFRRARRGSLTTDVKTGSLSGVRNIELKFINIRGSRNLEKARAGRTPNIMVRQKEHVSFVYHQGPKLRLSTGSPDAHISALTEIAGM